MLLKVAPSSAISSLPAGALNATVAAGACATWRMALEKRSSGLAICLPHSQPSGTRIASTIAVDAATLRMVSRKRWL